MRHLYRTDRDDTEPVGELCASGQAAAGQPNYHLMSVITQRNQVLHVPLGSLLLVSSVSLLVFIQVPLSYPSMATESMLVMAATLARVTAELTARSGKKAQQMQ